MPVLSDKTAVQESFAGRIAFPKLNKLTAINKEETRKLFRKHPAHLSCSDKPIAFCRSQSIRSNDRLLVTIGHFDIPIGVVTFLISINTVLFCYFLPADLFL